MKKLFLLLSCIVLCGACSRKEVKPQSLVIEAEMIFNLSNIEGFDETFFIMNKATLKDLGWEYKNGGFLSTTVKFPEKTFRTVNGSKISTDNHSCANVSNFPDEVLKTLILEENLNTEIVLNFNNGKYTIDATHFFDSMDMLCCSEKQNLYGGDRDEQPRGERCIDYNGPLGNQQNDEKGIQEVINFLGSDCNIAVVMGLCWGEHGQGKSCYRTHGEKICTELIPFL